ncbi:hypothetical protein [Mesorhizobium sp.]|uniref:hypothetical protein n=1 Tax=Mesorhizobium sp. TaxID=1871066 RepID=UPI000FE2EEC5|nr:hypothetical protein [Mesorhizobium sp.]RWJ94070.1 MAG: hypothetical protein EOR42_31670 [Mesorhizobium sp.]TIN06132.1 MAG: hypothetical protein E5Y14_30155 [Mesorhizobium sp.]
MYLKADGTEVWLKSPLRVPYLTISGLIDSSDSYGEIRRRLCRAYKLLYGIASDDAFIVKELQGSCLLLFCARADKNCALILLGKFYGHGNQKPHVLESLVQTIVSSTGEISREAGAVLRFEVVQPELAMCGD